jgi:hypothetical protein
MGIVIVKRGCYTLCWFATVRRVLSFKSDEAIAKPLANHQVNKFLNYSRPYPRADPSSWLVFPVR